MLYEVITYESIKSIRLQKASSLLLTNKYSTISEVANLCGYSSHSSFIKAFRGRFGKPRADRTEAFARPERPKRNVFFGGQRP